MNTKITRDTAVQLQSEMQALLEAFAAKHGLTLASRVSCTYETSGEAIYFSKPSFVAAAAPGDTPEAIAFRQHARAYGLDPAILGTTMLLVTTTGGAPRAAKIVGLLPRSRSKPVLIERDGKLYKVALSVITDALKRSSGGESA